MGIEKLNRACFLFRPGRGKLLKAWSEGNTPSDFLYGYVQLREQIPVLNLDALDLLKPGNCFGRIVWRWMDRLLSGFCLCKLGVSAAFAKRNTLLLQQLVVTNVDSIGLSVAFLRWCFPMRMLQLHLSQGLTNALESGELDHGVRSEFKRTFTAWILGQVEHLAVLGKGALDSMKRQRLRGRHGNSLIQFGVDTDFWCPSDSDTHSSSGRADYLLSVGSDAGRDYAALAAARLPLPLKVVSRLPLPAKVEWQVIPDVSDMELRELYRGARLVVLPLRNIPQPSGQSAALQAMACGAPVLVTRTSGFWDPGGWENGKNLLFLERPGDASEITAAVEQLLRQPAQLDRVAHAGCQRVKERYSIKRFARNLERWITSALEAQQQPLV